jgi:hypothetical protein
LDFVLVYNPIKSTVLRPKMPPLRLRFNVRHIIEQRERGKPTPAGKSPPRQRRGDLGVGFAFRTRSQFRRGQGEGCLTLPMICFLLYLNCCVPTRQRYSPISFLDTFWLLTLP